MSYDVVTMEDCASNFATFEVVGSTGTKYRVTLGGESFCSCTCEGFKYREDCKHVRQVYEQACLYNPQWRDPPKDIRLRPVSYLNEPRGPSTCPSCGGPMVLVLRAV